MAPHGAKTSGPVEARSSLPNTSQESGRARQRPHRSEMMTSERKPLLERIGDQGATVAVEQIEIELMGDRLSRRLRNSYARLLEEPLPERLRSLLDKLATSEARRNE